MLEDALGTNLDERYGVPRPASSHEPWEASATPASLCVFDEPIGSVMAMFVTSAQSNPIRAMARTVTFLWGMEPDGRLKLAAEEVARISERNIDSGFCTRRGLPKVLTHDDKLGHPCLMDEKQARIAGELYLDESTDTPGRVVWTLNVKSGRFHREPGNRPTNDQVRNVAKLFANFIKQPISLDLDDDLIPASVVGGATI